MKKSSSHLSSLICLAVCLTLAETQAAIVFDSDDVILFGNPGANTFGLTQTSGGATAGTLTAAGNDLSLAVSTNSVGSSQGYVISYFGTQTLTAVGDKITLSYTGQLTSIPGVAQATPFRVGLFNSNGTRIAANSTTVSNVAFADDTGYSSYYRTASGANSGSLTELAAGTPAVARTLFPGSPSTIPTSPSNAALGLAANNPFFGTFTLELTATGVLVTSTVTVGLNTYTNSVTDTSGAYVSFDTLGIYSQSTNATPTTFSILDMTVDVVPEPGTGAMAIFAFGLMALRLRSRARQMI